MNEHPKRIGILGGGFGGLYTALRLSQLPWENASQPEIVLIDKNDRFLFSPLLYELLTGELQTWEIAPPFSELLANTGVRFLQANITGIELQTKQVHLEHRPSLTCDRLVVALGGTTPLNFVPGAKEYAIPFRTLEDTYRLQEKLRVLEASDRDKIRIAIVGGGFSGVELACKLADRLGERGRLRIIERSEDILATAAEFNRQAAKQALEERGIWLDVETSVEEVGPEHLSLLYKSQSDEIAAEIVLWTAGTKASPLLDSFPFPKCDRGLIKLMPTLQIEGYEGIFAVGDIAATEEKIPATAQTAIQQADYCAWNLWASLCDRPLLPFRYNSLGEMMALGIDNATLTGLGIKLDGILAYLTRRLVYLYRLPALNHQLAVGFNWISQPLIEFLS
ncbi:MAG: NAD(P)/FAD-dependent oxidoreductase [Cyanobacteria bacterium SBLK]|nr:NAD(P)/FAD-dependent oxidoreductase [Cyanobacteria bacterium SBLK]